MSGAHAVVAAGDAREAALMLLARRDAGATVCPSEVARALAAAADIAPVAESWRSLMPVVHEAIDRLVAEGAVQLSWKGRTLAARAGPYRIGRRGST